MAGPFTLQIISGVSLGVGAAITVYVIYGSDHDGRWFTSLIAGLAVLSWTEVVLFPRFVSSYTVFDSPVRWATTFGPPIFFVAALLYLLGNRFNHLDSPRAVGPFVATIVLHVGDFALIYQTIDISTPGAFPNSPISPWDAFYVAATTFTTVGSGNIYPANDLSRVAVATESLLSVVIVAVGVALLIRRLR